MARKGGCDKSSRVALLVLLGVVAMFGLAALCMPEVRERFMGGARIGGVEHFDTRKKGDAVQLVHATWCGHCKTLLEKGGAWSQLKASLPGVSFSELEESTVEAKAAVSRGKIKGFPDIRVVKRGPQGPETVAAYDGERTAPAMKAWVLQHVDGK
jgi:hypothetical protein